MISKNKLMNLNNLDEDQLLKKGNGKLFLKNYIDAIKYFSKLINLNPNNWEALFGRGKAKFGIKDYTGAISDFTEGISLEPNGIYDFFIERGLSYKYLNNIESSEKDFSIAIHYLDKLIELTPKNELAIFKRGYAKENINDYLGAIEDYYQFIKLNPNKKRSICYLNFSFNKLKEKKYDQNLIKKIGEIFFSIGLIKYKIGHYQDAINHYTRSLELNPFNFNSLVNRASINEYLKNWESAKNDYLRANKIIPNNAMVINKLSKLKGKFRANNISKFINDNKTNGNFKNRLLKESNNKEFMSSRDANKFDNNGYHNLKKKYRTKDDLKNKKLLIYFCLFISLIIWIFVYESSSFVFLYTIIILSIYGFLN